MFALGSMWWLPFETCDSFETVLLATLAWYTALQGGLCCAHACLPVVHAVIRVHWGATFEFRISTSLRMCTATTTPLKDSIQARSCTCTSLLLRHLAQRLSARGFFHHRIERFLLCGSPATISDIQAYIRLF